MYSYRILSTTKETKTYLHQKKMNPAGPSIKYQVHIVVSEAAA